MPVEVIGLPSRLRYAAGVVPNCSLKRRVKWGTDLKPLAYAISLTVPSVSRSQWAACFKWKAFHDQFVSYGSPPIPLVREAMLGPDAGPVLR